MILYFFGFIILMLALFFGSAFLGSLIKAKISFRKIEQIFHRAPGLKGNFIGAFFGVLTPFCSCTTVPIFASLVEAEVPFGTAVSFLIASPAVNFSGIIFLLFLFNIKTAAYYIFGCLAVAVVGGYLLGHFKTKDQVLESFVALSQNCTIETYHDAFRLSLRYIRYFIPVVLVSGIIGIAMYQYVPQGLLLWVTGNNSLWAIPAAVLLGAFLYADIILLIPLGAALLIKGVNPGIVLSFMMATSGISLSSVLLLRKILKTKPLIIFVAILLSLYSLMGFVFYFL